MKQHDMTPQDLSYEMRDERKAAYSEYLAFVEDRKKRKAAFEEAQQHRCAISRWYHAQLQKIRDRWDDDEEVDLLSDANPMAGFQLYKKQHSGKNK